MYNCYEQIQCSRCNGWGWLGHNPKELIDFLDYLVNRDALQKYDIKQIKAWRKRISDFYDRNAQNTHEWTKKRKTSLQEYYQRLGITPEEFGEDIRKTNLQKEPELYDSMAEPPQKGKKKKKLNPD
jgi:hypothetical protein